MQGCRNTVPKRSQIVSGCTSQSVKRGGKGLINEGGMGRLYR